MHVLLMYYLNSRDAKSSDDRQMKLEFYITWRRTSSRVVLVNFDRSRSVINISRDVVESGCNWNAL